MKQTSSHTQCCKNLPKYQILYSCGFEPDQTVFVCEDHYQQELFQKYIKKMEKI